MACVPDRCRNCGEPLRAGAATCAECGTFVRDLRPDHVASRLVVGLVIGLVVGAALLAVNAYVHFVFTYAAGRAGCIASPVGARIHDVVMLAIVLALVYGGVRLIARGRTLVPVAMIVAGVVLLAPATMCSYSEFIGPAIACQV